jgi:hypothetical protein
MNISEEERQRRSDFMKNLKAQQLLTKITE